MAPSNWQVWAGAAPPANAVGMSSTSSIQIGKRDAQCYRDDI